MGLLAIIQIPCHHVLANEIALNLKYRISLKQIFNINLLCINSINFTRKGSSLVIVYKVEWCIYDTLI